jgi:hypothetical protein
MIDFNAKREHLVLRTNGGFTAATVAEAATVRATEAHASARERKAITKRAIRTVGAPLVDAARPSAGAPLLLTEAEAKSLAFRLGRAQTRNRLGAGRGRRQRRRA